MVLSPRVPLLVAVFLCGLFAACSGEREAFDQRTVPESRTESVSSQQPMLPAFAMPGERLRLKGDSYDDVRASNPDVYNITAPSSAPIVASAEFEPKTGLLVGWTGSFPQLTAQIVAAAKQVGDVQVIHWGTAALSEFEQQMAFYGVSTSGLSYLNMPHESIWIRDYGPISVSHPGSDTLAFVDPRYYHARVYDDGVPHKVATSLGINAFKMPVDFEGGNFMSDGQGTCVVSQGVLWFNPAVTEAQIRQYFREYLGCYQLVILNPLNGEGTTHIDMFTKFVDRDTVLLGSYESWQDNTNKGLMDQNQAIYEAVTLADGSPLEVVRMPMPSNADGAFRTYINSQFINGKNLIPVYSDDTTYQDEAVAIWNDVMPDWEHVLLDATQLIQWSGAIHCILMEFGGGTLGTYQSPPAEICSNADCYPANTQGNLGCVPVPVYGECGDDGVQWCDLGETQSSTCSANCAWLGDAGRYGCSDGPACEPDCVAKACGNDGCGGSCGSCGDGLACQGNQCVADEGDCGGVSYQGCCEGDTLKYCNNNGSLATVNCQQSCGWDSGDGWYDCNEQGADPSGTHPLECPGPACTPDCDGKQCGVDGCGGVCGSCGSNQSCVEGQCESGCTPLCNGAQCGDDGCGGSCGVCAADEACQQGQCVVSCTPACDSKECGSDGCGGSCGACPTGSACEAGLCQSTCEPQCGENQCGGDGCGGSCGSCGAGEICDAGQCAELPDESCGGLSWEGVCEPDGTVTWCDEDGQLQSQTCASGCCGWLTDDEYYWCFSNQLCGYCYNECELGETGCSVLGTHTWSCEDVTENWGCRTRVWTPCSAGCDLDTGACVTDCEADCTGKQCGDDGCGGSCGGCAPGQICTQVGYCEEAPCVPDCSGKSCGDDGCGGNCGDCSPTENCSSDFECVPGVCVPDCESKVCGSDGCGASCGQCDSGSICDGGGQCVPAPCVPDCDGQSCGSDGCGGSCGECAADESCVQGSCTLVCTPSCDNKSCGDDGCGGSCGSCLEGELCTEAGQCVEECTPSCDWQQCGSDGCGGSCGTCPDGQVCTDVYLCATIAGCGNVPAEGSCEGQVLTWCESNTVKSKDCAAEDKLCQFVEGEGYLCVEDTSCVPDCEGRSCGPNGCGGVCGSCPPGQACTSDGLCETTSDCGDVTYQGYCEGSVVVWCEAGVLSEYDCQQQDKDCGFVEGIGATCVAPPCEPACQDRECGDDGCGGTCGACPPGQLCQEGLCTESAPVDEIDAGSSGASDAEGNGQDTGESSGSGTSGPEPASEAGEQSVPDGTLPIAESAGESPKAGGCQVARKRPLGALIVMVFGCLLWGVGRRRVSDQGPS